MNAAKKQQRIPVRRPGEADRANVDAVRASTETVSGEAVPAEVRPLSEPDVTAGEETVDWRDIALRLRAEMDNYRKRQQRLAEEQTTLERKRLLTAFLTVPDNLERIIAHLQRDNPHHQSIQVVYDEFMKVLRLEGVEPFVAVGAPFDPLLHEAVAMVPATDGQCEEMRVIDEEQKGYRIGEQVLRPARVIVAKR